MALKCCQQCNTPNTTPKNVLLSSDFNKNVLIRIFSCYCFTFIPISKKIKQQLNSLSSIKDGQKKCEQGEMRAATYLQYYNKRKNPIYK